MLGDNFLRWRGYRFTGWCGNDWDRGGCGHHTDWDGGGGRGRGFGRVVQVGIEVGGAGGCGGGGSCHTAAAAVVAQLREGRNVGILQKSLLVSTMVNEKERTMDYEKETQEVY